MSKHPHGKHRWIQTLFAGNETIIVRFYLGNTAQHVVAQFLYGSKPDQPIEVFTSLNPKASFTLEAFALDMYRASISPDEYANTVWHHLDRLWNKTFRKDTTL